MFAIVMPAFHSQMVQVDEKVSGFIGDNVVLRCTFTSSNPTVRITQVTWQKATNGTKQNVAIYNPNMGVSILPPYGNRTSFKNPSLNDATLQLSHLELEDEGVYICEFATFPTGNRESQLNLTVWVKPTNRMELAANPITAITGKAEKIPVATCTSTNGKPPGVISWETRLNGETTIKEIRNKNGTYTVTSTFMLAPSREAHRQHLTCVVNYLMERFTEATMLNVLYEPEVNVEGFDGNWYLNRPDVKLICKSDANPAVTSYHWTVLNGSRPRNMEIQNNTLFFKGPVTYDLAGTYVCEATNPVGTRSGLVVVNVTESPANTQNPNDAIQGNEDEKRFSAIIGAIVGGVLLIAITAVIVFLVVRRNQRTFKGNYSTKKHAFGNGYSKAGLPPNPPITQNLQYPEDSDDEKKPHPLNISYDDDSKMSHGFEVESKTPYYTVDEGESRDYDHRTLSFQYDPEGPDMTDDMVPQNDGSIVSKKEWYV